MKGDLTYLRHILDAVERIEANASKGRDAFMADVNLQDGVVRQLEIIGEATKRLSPEIRGRHRAVPWRRIAGLRDKLIHQYMGVDLAIVWEIATQSIPELRSSVVRMISEEQRRPEGER